MHTDDDPYNYYSKSKTKDICDIRLHDFVRESHFIDDFAKSANLTAFGSS